MTQWYFYSKMTKHYAGLEEMSHVLKNFSAKKANCFSEMDRAFVNKTICALYGSLEEFDQQIREVVAPSLIRVSTSIYGEFWPWFKMWSPTLFFIIFAETPNVAADQRLSNGVVLAHIAGQFVIAVWWAVIAQFAIWRLAFYTFRRRRSFFGFVLALVAQSLLLLPLRPVSIVVAFFFSSEPFQWAFPTELASINMNWCEKPLSVEEPVQTGALDKFVSMENLEEVCLSRFKWMCSPTEVLGVILPLILIAYIFWHLPCKDKSEFEGEENAFSDCQPEKSKTKKVADTV